MKVSSRSEGGRVEQFFNIMTKLRDSFKFYFALPDRFIFVSKSEQQIAVRHSIASIPNSALIENGIHIDNKVYNEGERASILQSLIKQFQAK